MIATEQRRITCRDVWLLAAAAAAMAAVRVGLWLLPFRLVHGAAARLAAPSPYFERAVRPMDRVVWAVSAAARFVPRASCLTQSLTAHVLLRRAGHPAVLKVGVARDGGGFDAHAWVECEGRVVVGDVDLRRYAPVANLSDV